MNPDYPFTLSVYRQALKQANTLFNRAMSVDDKTMIKKWQAERNRLLDIIANYKTFKEGAD